MEKKTVLSFKQILAYVYKNLFEKFIETHHPQHTKWKKDSHQPLHSKLEKSNFLYIETR